MNRDAIRQTKEHCRFLCGLTSLSLLFFGLVGCRTIPESTPSSRQQAEADLVVNFRSWQAIAFLKPDITGRANALAVWPTTFTRDGVEKLLRNLKMPRDLVVVILDRRYCPDPVTAGGGMDEIQTFFQAQAFRRVVFQDGSAWTRSQGYPILRDTSTVSNAHQGPIPLVSNRQASTTLGKQPRYLSLRSTRRNGYER